MSRAIDPSTHTASDAPPSDDAFAEVALAHLSHLHFAARRLSRSAMDAEDLVQDTYRLALEHYRHLRNLTHCRAWLHRILQRQAISHHRRDWLTANRVDLHRHADGVREVELPAPATHDAIERLSLREIREAIDALPADQRAAVMLCDVEGFSYHDIASITDAPVGTVRSRIARARARLMTQLRDHAEALGIVRHEDLPTGRIREN